MLTSLTWLATLSLLQSAPAASDPASDNASDAVGSQDSAVPAVACRSEAHRAFDFWIGEWDVVATGTDRQVGESRIERLSGGCAIRETWMPTNGPSGTSLSLLNHRTARWEQLWIGVDGKRVDFAGGLVDANMVLTGYWDSIGGPGKDALVRMTFTPNPDGTVRQAGEVSQDHGTRWRPFFDYTYRRKAI